MIKMKLFSTQLIRFAIFERHEHEVDAVVDCGFGNNVASTIVDCRTDNPSILRQGAGIID